MTISESLQRLIKEEGLNNITFSQMLAISHTTTSRYLNGTRIPPLNRLKQIAFVFNRRCTLVLENDKITGKFVFRESLRDISFDDKIEQSRKALYHYATFRMHLRKEDAEDIVQDTIIKGMLLINTWRPEIALTTWLIAILKRSRNKWNSKLVFVENYIENEQLTIEAENTFRSHPKLFECVESLSPADKDLFKLYLNGLSYKFISLHKNCTESAVKMRIRALKLRLYRKLSVHSKELSQ